MKLDTAHNITNVLMSITYGVGTAALGYTLFTIEFWLGLPVVMGTTVYTLQQDFKEQT